MVKATLDIFQEGDKLYYYFLKLIYLFLAALGLRWLHAGFL